MGEVDNCQSKNDLATFTSLPHFSFLSLDPKVSPEIAMQQCKSYNNSTRFLFSLLSPPHHALSLSLSDCFLVLFCFQARGSQGGYAKTPWQASMATQKAWDFAGCIWMRWMHWIQTEEADWSRLSRKFWGLWIDGRVDCVDSVSTIDVEIESLSESLSSRLRRPGENSTKPRVGPARNQF